MQLQESAEMYLETIYLLSKKKNIVRSIDVAEYMNYSKPSVSRAIGLLKNGGYILMDKDGSLTLTEKGNETANKIFERHTILSKLLIKIGVLPDVATKEACKIEHVISDDTLKKIKEFLEI